MQKYHSITYICLNFANALNVNARPTKIFFFIYKGCHGQSCKKIDIWLSNFR